ncbi:DNA cytosine methyltransferase [Actinoplanes sp. NPDC026623]|uniref:DNA cytosine methyltransferase n=1 Tax=Actinoplanes sp. NPDC026623 TaxID=3155610 RepID=UPI0033E2A824
MFTGAGGLALGLHGAGFRHRLAVEFYTRACESLRNNGAKDCPDLKAAADAIPTADASWPLVEGPVQDVDFTPFLNKVTLLAGGVPCQPWSIAGKKQDIEEKIGGERNLWPEMFRVAHETRPKVIIAENVVGLTRPSFKGYYDYILDGLSLPHEIRGNDEDWRIHHARLRKRLNDDGVPDDERYVVRAATLNAADFGVPQIRKRLFIVAYRADLGIDGWVPPSPSHSQASLVNDLIEGGYWKRHQIEPRIEVTADLTPTLPDERKAWRTVRDALCDPVDLVEPGVDTPIGLVEPKLNRKPSSGPAHHVGWPGARPYRGHQPSDLDWPSKTIKAGVHGVAGGELTVNDRLGRYRYLTVREVARLMTFPDDWTFDGTRGPQMRQLGNAVPVDLARAIGDSVRIQLRPDEARDDGAEVAGDRGIV